MRSIPALEVRRQIGPHSSTAFHDLLTQKLKNRSAEVDVFLMDVIWPPEFASAGWALALDERFSQEERGQFFPAGIAANTYERQALRGAAQHRHRHAVLSQRSFGSARLEAA
jgi:hypothetical protein